LDEQLTDPLPFLIRGTQQEDPISNKIHEEIQQRMNGQYQPLHAPRTQPGGVKDFLLMKELMVVLSQVWDRITGARAGDAVTVTTHTTHDHHQDDDLGVSDRSSEITESPPEYSV
jgi:hypothetical protein